MQQERIQPRPLYGIGTVARLTGLKPDTLRVWERRYGLGASHKSSTGRRQYTQSDLEHLQLVSALLKSGARIGEIAGAERKTLELLLRSQGKSGIDAIPAPKPKAMFVGQGLCDWLEEHQGCLTHVDALFARVSVAEADVAMFEPYGQVDILVLECTTLAASQFARIHSLAQDMNARQIMVTYQFCNERWLQELKANDITAMAFPPDSSFLAFELGRYAAEHLAGQGERDLGQLVAIKPREFSERELSAARKLKSTLDCECPRHITDLIRALANFEEYSSSCSVENWQDAAVHSCIYAYTGQARWLMERALKAVLEQRAGEFDRLVQLQTAEKVSDVA